jgi:hypothetical protein
MPAIADEDRWVAVYVARRALPRSMDEPPRNVLEDLAKLPSAFAEQKVEQLNHPYVCAGGEHVGLGTESVDSTCRPVGSREAPPPR